MRLFTNIILCILPVLLLTSCSPSNTAHKAAIGYSAAGLLGSIFRNTFGQSAKNSTSLTEADLTDKAICTAAVKFSGVTPIRDTSTWYENYVVDGKRYRTINIWVRRSLQPSTLPRKHQQPNSRRRLLRAWTSYFKTT